MVAQDPLDLVKSVTTPHLLLRKIELLWAPFLRSQSLDCQAGAAGVAETCFELALVGDLSQAFGFAGGELQL